MKKQNGSFVFSSSSRLLILMVLAVMFVSPLLVIVIFRGKAPTTTAAATSKKRDIFPVGRFGNLVLTRDQSVASRVNCSTCAAERLGRFAFWCHCGGDVLDGMHVQHLLPSSSASTKRVFLAACSMIRGDDDYLKEWIDFHLDQGVERIVLYLDEDDDAKRFNTRLLLEAYKKVEIVDSGLFRGFPERQFVAMNHCVRLMALSEWVAVFDIDEFFVPMRFESLREAVVALGNGRSEVSSLFVPQAFFGAPPNAPTSGSVLSRFRLREYSFLAGHHVASGRFVGKSIVRQAMFKHMHTVHTMDTTSGERVTVNAEDLRINHYICRTRKEQQEREEKGASWSSKIKEKWEEFCENLYLSVRDDSIERFIPK